MKTKKKIHKSFDEAYKYLTKKFEKISNDEVIVFFEKMKLFYMGIPNENDFDEVKKVVNKLATDDIFHIWKEIDKLKKKDKSK